MPETVTKSCRICLQEVKEDAPYHFLNDESDLTLQSKLLDFLPQLDLNLTQNPISCSQCTTTINEIHQFKQLCVHNEDIIRKLSLQEAPLNDATHLFKEEQSHETIKEEIVEDPIKNEHYSLDTDEQKCLQINMDIPECIEESTSPKASYYCYNCSYCTDKKFNLVRHVSTHRNGYSESIELLQCDLCKFNTHARSGLKIHKKRYHNKQFNKCNNTGSNKDNLINNQELVHTYTKEKPFGCNICNFRCNQKSYLKMHLRIHTKEKPFCCSMCDFRCNQRSYLKRHLRIHTKEKPFCCNICHACFNDKSNLRQHLRTHTGEKPFSCNTCNYRCNVMSSLKKHLRTHTGEKPFCCSICNYRCNVMSSLKKHSRTHSKEQPFCCNICDYRSNRIASLKKHSRTHTNEKPFCCNICDYRCSQKSRLKRHLFVHTGEKPYKCDICDYRCYDTSCLKRHVHTHTGEKPFCCNICDYRSSQMGNLKKHSRVHTREKPFSCNICNYRCKDMSSLKMHLGTHPG